jgi:hypothetical protein
MSYDHISFKSNVVFVKLGFGTRVMKAFCKFCRLFPSSVYSPVNV